MIWRSALNILWALARNVFQHGHQCIRLEETTWGWEWECSCGSYGDWSTSEVAAIRGFGYHLDKTNASA